MTPDSHTNPSCFHTIQIPIAQVKKRDFRAFARKRLAGQWMGPRFDRRKLLVPRMRSAPLRLCYCRTLEKPSA